MKAGKGKELIPLIEEDIEQLRWVPKEGVFSFLRNSYKNIMKIAKNGGLFLSNENKNLHQIIIEKNQKRFYYKLKY